MGGREHKKSASSCLARESLIPFYVDGRTHSFELFKDKYNEIVFDNSLAQKKGNGEAETPPSPFGLAFEASGI